MSGDVLEIKGLSVDYGYHDDAVHALRDVSLSLGRGEILGLAGESGCGKSTLAYAATRLLPPPGLITGGEVLFHSRTGETLDLLRLPDDRLRAARWDEIAIVFQGAMNSLNPVRRVGRQLTDVMAAHRPGVPMSVHKRRARELLALVGIPADRMPAYPHQLSGGQRQRVMIAMALALDPQIVIMDEPTTALDVVTQRQIVERLAALRAELDFAVVFITHDVSLLIEMADRIAVMYADPRHPYTRGLLGSFPPLRGPRRALSGIPGAPPDLAALPPGCAFAPRCPHAFAPCREKGPELIGDRRRAACFLPAG